MTSGQTIPVTDNSSGRLPGLGDPGGLLSEAVLVDLGEPMKTTGLPHIPLLASVLDQPLNTQKGDFYYKRKQMNSKDN